ncbi:MAG: hypothetical protein M1160_00455 [Candidatus Marsarchaeota archaeon]|jgi:hypothetical protein|nr:hypothetical protein [Candidatus Marsarchaeota archaeon]MCL5111341.1 hypothetical protein [Candidatus Marsarchaeota archaeon]
MTSSQTAYEPRGLGLDTETIRSAAVQRTYYSALDAASIGIETLSRGTRQVLLHAESGNALEVQAKRGVITEIDYFLAVISKFNKVAAFTGNAALATDMERGMYAYLRKMLPGVAVVRDAALYLRMLLRSEEQDKLGENAEQISATISDGVGDLKNKIGLARALPYESEKEIMERIKSQFD